MYKIIIDRKAEKETQKIPLKFRRVIDSEILSLASDQRPHNCKKLTEKEGYRIRIGNYRVLYTVDDTAKVVVIYRIKIKGESTYK